MGGRAGVPWHDQGTEGRQGGWTETDDRGTGREEGAGWPGGAPSAGAHPCCGRMPVDPCLCPCAGRHTCAHTGVHSACVQVHVHVRREVHMHICAVAHGMGGAGVHVDESGLCHSVTYWASCR